MMSAIVPLVRPLSPLFLGAALILTSACGSQIGDHCTKSSDCPDICQTGGGFPDGVCTVECDTNDQCPEGFTCISDSSGICMQNCSSNAECTEALGSDWVCEDKSLQTGSGTAMVCYGS